MTLEPQLQLTATSERTNHPALEAAARAHPGGVVAWVEGGVELARVADGDPAEVESPPTVLLTRRSGRGREQMPNVLILDRDGTLIEDRHYLSDPARVQLLPGAAAGLRALAADGYRLVVVTNQSGVARGLVTLDQLAAIHARLEALLGEEGVRLDGIYSCPHDGMSLCACRKPAPGLVHQAAAELGFDPARAVVVGDKVSDLELGRRLGLPTVLVATGQGARALAEGPGLADYLVEDLAELARIATHPAGFPIVRSIP